MIMRAWDEPHGFTDLDMGITDADTAGETLSVTVWQESAGMPWFWDLSECKMFPDGDGECEWGDQWIAGGLAPTQAEAEAAGEAAKESYIRDLIRK